MRTFLALEIHDDALLESIAKIQSDFKTWGKPVDKQNLHFTLLFLGEIPDKSVKDVQKTLNSIAIKPVEVKFTHLGAFPNTRSPRVIWLGVDEISSKQLIELASRIQKNLESLGFKPDKPFKPHLTIFRMKKRIDVSHIVEKFKTIELGKELIRELKFKESILTPNGPIYSDLQIVFAQ
jgi:2'-5' RNA ligase